MSNMTLDSHEVWKPIDGSVYEVSSLGRVRNSTTRKVLKTQDKHGYRVLGLKINGKVKKCSVHRLVATAFIPNPYGKEQVNHKDGNHANNRVDNLEWVTPEENFKHAVENDLYRKGVERAKANGGSGYNRKDKPKAYLKNSERISKQSYEELVKEAEDRGCTVGGLLKKLKKEINNANNLSEEYRIKVETANDRISELEERLDNKSSWEERNKYLIGNKKNYLTIIGVGRDKWGTKLICQCDCGNIKLVQKVFFDREKIKSCGCKHDDLAREAKPIDNKKQDWLHSVWVRKHRTPEWYEDWKEYDAFYEWAYANGYSFGKHLWRLDFNKGFSPNNCEWRDRTQTNCLRTQKNKPSYPCNGEDLTVVQAAEKYNLGEQFLRYRIKQGMTLEEAVNTPKCSNGRKSNILISA